jgi:hypothetical protein
MKAIFACALLSLAGCYNTVVRAGPVAQMEEQKQTSFNFLWGITTGTVVTPECPGGLGRVEVYLPWWDYFLMPLTIGIVSAHETEYVCSAPHP